MTNDEKNIKIAEVTLKAVDQIGEAAAKEIEALAANILQDAEDLASQLTDLAGTMRQHTITAAGMVADFVKRSATTTSLIRDLEERLRTDMGIENGGKPEGSRNNGEDTAQVP